MMAHELLVADEYLENVLRIAKAGLKRATSVWDDDWTDKFQHIIDEAERAQDILRKPHE